MGLGATHMSLHCNWHACVRACVIYIFKRIIFKHDCTTILVSFPRALSLMNVHSYLCL